VKGGTKLKETRDSWQRYSQTCNVAMAMAAPSRRKKEVELLSSHLSLGSVTIGSHWSFSVCCLFSSLVVLVNSTMISRGLFMRAYKNMNHATKIKKQ
jgi:hypothetical protein